MALSLRKQVDRARANADKLSNAIYACAPNDTTPFQDCLKLAPYLLQQEYAAVRSKIAELEYAAVAAGKAYPGTFGITWCR